MRFNEISHFFRKMFGKNPAISNFDFFNAVESTVCEMMLNIEKMNYNQVTFDVIGSNACLFQINVLASDLKNLAEDLVELDKKFKFTSDYLILSEIDKAKKHCQSCFIHLSNILNILKSNPIEDLSNDTLMGFIDKFESDVKIVASCIKRIGTLAYEPHLSKFDSRGRSLIEFQTQRIQSQVMLACVQVCIVSYDKMLNMPYFYRQAVAFQYIEKFRLSVEQLIACFITTPFSPEHYHAILFNLFSYLEAIRFCTNRHSKSGKQVEQQIKLLAHDIRKVSFSVDCEKQTLSRKE